MDPVSDVLDDRLLSYFVRKVWISLSTARQKHVGYGIGYTLLPFPNLSRFSGSVVPAAVVSYASPGLSLPNVSAEDVRAPGGLGSSVSGMVSQSCGSASLDFVVFLLCCSKRHRVSARESMRISHATTRFCRLRGFDEWYHGVPLDLGCTGRGLDIPRPIVGCLGLVVSCVVSFSPGGLWL